MCERELGIDHNNNKDIGGKTVTVENSDAEGRNNDEEQVVVDINNVETIDETNETCENNIEEEEGVGEGVVGLDDNNIKDIEEKNCLLYTSPSPRDRTRSRMPSSA